MFQNDQECIEFMKGIDEQLEELIMFLGEVPERLPRERVAKARKMLSSVKSTLREYYNKNKTTRAQAAMRRLERNFCFPVIHEAFCAIYVTPNHRPSAKWLNELADAQGEIRFYLQQIT